MKFAFILVEKAFYPVAVLCRLLDVSRSGFYAWSKRPPSNRQIDDERLTVEIVALHERSRKTFGSPRIQRSLRRDGTRVSRKRVARLMRNRQICGRKPRRFKATTDSRHANPIAPNIVGRMFSATAPDRVWVTDVKAIWTDEGWFYLAVMIDLFSRRVVGWAGSESNDTTLALAALRSATARRTVAPGLIHHSDRGSPYASADYREALDGIAAVASMSRKGNCWDNAVAESFFSTISHELLSDQRFATHAQSLEVVGEWIEDFYNLTRMHSTIGYLSPVEYELRCRTKDQAA